ncbi:hypothetical protein V8E36_001773 [Tilletia maclaganii]
MMAFLLRCGFAEVQLGCCYAEVPKTCVGGQVRKHDLQRHFKDLSELQKYSKASDDSQLWAVGKILRDPPAP